LLYKAKPKNRENPFRIRFALFCSKAKPKNIGNSSKVKPKNIRNPFRIGFALFFYPKIMKHEIARQQKKKPYGKCLPQK